MFFSFNSLRLIFAVIVAGATLANAYASLMNIELVPYPNIFIELYRSFRDWLVPEINIPFLLPSVHFFDLLVFWISMAEVTALAIYIKELICPNPNVLILMKSRGRSGERGARLIHTIGSIVYWPLYSIGLIVSAIFYLFLPSVEIAQFKTLMTLGIGDRTEHEANIEKLRDFVRKSFEEDRRVMVIVGIQIIAVFTAFLMIALNSKIVFVFEYIDNIISQLI